MTWNRFFFFRLLFFSAGFLFVFICGTFLCLCDAQCMQCSCFILLSRGFRLKKDSDTQLYEIIGVSCWNSWSCAEIMRKKGTKKQLLNLVYMAKQRGKKWAMTQGGSQKSGNTIHILCITYRTRENCIWKVSNMRHMRQNQFMAFSAGTKILVIKTLFSIKMLCYTLLRTNNDKEKC